jgi:hypothetical protein
MTDKQRAKKIKRMYRLAGGLYAEMHNNNEIPKAAVEELMLAHDAVCRAIDVLERP